MSKIDPNRLYTALLNTGLQQKDNPLYQVIYNLIGTVVDLLRQVEAFPVSGGGSSVTNITNNNIIQQLSNFFDDDGEDVMIYPPGGGISSGSSGGGLSNAQMAARILLDQDRSSSSSGASGGSQGIQGIQGIQGVSGAQGIPGFDGEDAEGINLFRLQKFDGDLEPVTSRMFSYNTRVVGTIYQAASDGLLIGTAYTGPGANSTFNILADSSNPPVTERAQVGSNMTGSNYAAIPFCVPIRKGDYYKIVDLNPTGIMVTIFWVPLGTRG